MSVASLVLPAGQQPTDASVRWRVGGSAGGCVNDRSVGNRAAWIQVPGVPWAMGLLVALALED
jgi:hypothetical protein